MSTLFEFFKVAPEDQDTLLDLIDWLEQTNIDGLTMERKELPHVKGDLCDPSIIMAIVSNVITLTSIVVTIATWQRNKEVAIEPTLKELTAGELNFSYG